MGHLEGEVMEEVNTAIAVSFGIGRPEGAEGGASQGVVTDRPEAVG